MKKYKIISIIILTLLSSVITNAQTQYSLSYCKEMAIKNNAKIKKANLEINASEETKSAAYTKYYPQLSIMANGMYALEDLMKYTMDGGNLPVWNGKDPSQLRKPTQFAYMPATEISMLDNLFVGNVMLMQPLYAGGRISTGNELAELAIDINKDKLNIEKYSVNQKTEELYWKLVSLLEKSKTLDSYIYFLNNLQKDVNTAYSAGLVERNDVLKVSIKLSELNINKIELQNGIDMLREALCQHIGISFDNNLIPSDTIFDIRKPEIYYLEIEKAVPNRYESLLLQKAVNAEKLQTDLKLGEYLPEVGVGATYMYMNVLDKGSFNGLLFASVKVPISGWWEASHSLEEHRIKEEIALTTQKETSELLALQISQAWKALNESFNKIELGNNMVDEAIENFKVVESNYNAGVIGLSDYLEAKATLQKSQDQVIEFKTNYQFATAKYLQAIGNY